MKTYYFEVEHAKKYGVEEAIVINNFQYWITKNKSEGRHCIEGRTWTYWSFTSISDFFPFWTPKIVRRIMTSLRDQGVLISGQFSEKVNDRTNWYAFVDEEKFVGPNGLTDRGPKRSDRGTVRSDQTGSRSAQTVRSSSTNNESDKGEEKHADARFGPFVSFAHDEFKRITGDSLATDGRDYRELSSFCKANSETKFPLDHMTASWTRFLLERRKDKFLQRQRTLQYFASHYNSFAGGKTNGERPNGDARGFDAIRQATQEIVAECLDAPLFADEEDAARREAEH